MEQLCSSTPKSHLYYIFAFLLFFTFNLYFKQSYITCWNWVFTISFILISYKISLSAFFNTLNYMFCYKVIKCFGFPINTCFTADNIYIYIFDITDVCTYIWLKKLPHREKMVNSRKIVDLCPRDIIKEFWMNTLSTVFPISFAYFTLVKFHKAFSIFFMYFKKLLKVVLKIFLCTLERNIFTTCRINNKKIIQSLVFNFVHLIYAIFSFISKF